MTPVPVFCCPKCGAVGDVTHVERREQAEYDQMIADFQALDADPSRSASVAFYLSSAYRTRLREVRSGLGGPWLDCSCPRCAHRWRERPLDAAAVAAESTPIYDAMSSA